MSLKEIVSAQEIVKNYGDLHVLKGVDLVAHEHDVITLIGASGSGKSTFLRCLNLLEVPSGGKLRLVGEDISFQQKSGVAQPSLNHKQVNRLRAQTGMVFQSFNLWSHMTALDNVVTPIVHVLGIPRKEAVVRARSYLAKVGLSERENYYPAHLSGGQQQRCAIARALAMEPQLLLFDEPTSALDPELVGEVLRVMRGLAEEGRTMIVVTHEMNFAREVSKEVLFLRNGQIEERGTPEAIFLNAQSAACRAFVGKAA